MKTLSGGLIKHNGFVLGINLEYPYSDIQEILITDYSNYDSAKALNGGKYATGLRFKRTGKKAFTRIEWSSCEMLDEVETVATVEEVARDTLEHYNKEGIEIALFKNCSCTNCRKKLAEKRGELIRNPVTDFLTDFYNGAFTIKCDRCSMVNKF